MTGTGVRSHCERPIVVTATDTDSLPADGA
jgi:hypothetical protein